MIKFLSKVVYKKLYIFGYYIKHNKNLYVFFTKMQFAVIISLLCEIKLKIFMIN